MQSLKNKDSMWWSMVEQFPKMRNSVLSLGNTEEEEYDIWFNVRQILEPGI